MRFPFVRAALACAALTPVVFVSTARAQIIPIGPFAGALNETWESFPHYFDAGELPSPTDIMGGAAAISNTESGLNGMIVYQPGVGADFGLNTSGFAQVSDGAKGMGINSNSTTTIVFDNPVGAFGAFWGASTRVQDPAPVTLNFFDAGNVLIGTETFTYSRSGSVDGLLEFHGYSSTVGITSLTYQGHLVVIDSLRANPLIPAAAIPEPGTLALLLVGTLTTGAGVRRRRRA